jgi:hypothetical protein
MGCWESYILFDLVCALSPVSTCIELYSVDYGNGQSVHVFTTLSLCPFPIPQWVSYILRHICVMARIYVYIKNICWVQIMCLGIGCCIFFFLTPSSRPIEGLKHNGRINKRWHLSTQRLLSTKKCLTKGAHKTLQLLLLSQVHISFPFGVWLG